MTDRIEDNKAATTEPSGTVDWTKDIYVNHIGDRYDLNKLNDTFNSECARKDGVLNLLKIPPAEELYARASCVKEKRDNAGALFDRYEITNLGLRLAEKLGNAATKGESSVAVAKGFIAPEAPKSYDPIFAELNKKGYKTAWVHSPSGQEVEQGKPLPSEMAQRYDLVVKFK